MAVNTAYLVFQRDRNGSSRCGEWFLLGAGARHSERARRIFLDDQFTPELLPEFSCKVSEFFED